MVSYVHMEYTAKIICQIFQYSIQQFYDEIFDICVSITGYFLQGINIHQRSKNSQHFMLDHPNFHNISIYTYKQLIFPTFMLSYDVYTTRLLN